MPARPALRASCACGTVVLEARGAPIATTVCYCDDCEAAGRQIEALPAAQPALDPDGGTGLVVFRQDRLACVQGADRLSAVKLRPSSPTSRHLATCCNSAMYLGFDDARHWVDVFRNRVDPDPPPVQMRTCTRFRSSPEPMPDDARCCPGYPFGLIGRLLAARVAMLFGP